jgi:uncharacterized protein YjbI with pentapeptide repeats
VIELRHKQTRRVLYRIPADSLDGVDLHRANLDELDLRAMRLRGANLQRSNLLRADLSDAIATGADLQKAVLDEATLQRTDLTGADLREASLRSADLRGARLVSAGLDRANFEWAAMQGADLTGASLHEANFFGADLRGAVLSGATGLHTATLGDVIHDKSTEWPEGNWQRPDPLIHGRRAWQYSLRTLILLLTAYAVLLFLTKEFIQYFRTVDAPASIDLILAAFSALPLLLLGILLLHAAKKILRRGTPDAPPTPRPPEQTT